MTCFVLSRNPPFCSMAPATRLFAGSWPAPICTSDWTASPMLSVRGSEGARKSGILRGVSPTTEFVRRSEVSDIPDVSSSSDEEDSPGSLLYPPCEASRQLAGECPRVVLSEWARSASSRSALRSRSSDSEFCIRFPWGF